MRARGFLRLMAAALMGGVLMLGGPAARADDQKTLLDFKDQLGLSATQVETIQKALTSFKQDAQSLSARLKTVEGQVNSELQSHAPLESIKSHLDTYYDLRCRLRYADVVVARTIEDTLTSDQMAKWRQMQKAASAREKDKDTPK